VVTGSLPSLGNTAPVLFVSGTTAAVAAGVDTYKNTVVHQSQGFWKDLLTDGDGLALHRVQIVIANAIVGLAFLLGTFETLTIEAFDNTWVALLGASSVAFCGLKGAAPDAATAAAARAAQR
jgi:hypothetical protein